MPKEDFIIVDSSDFTHVVWCKKCDTTYGPYLSHNEGRHQAAKHRRDFHGKQCSVEGCTDLSRTKGMCYAHYNKAFYQEKKREA